MRTILALILALAGLLQGACKPRPQTAVAEKSAAPSPEKKVAVLYFEEISDEAPGGPAVHGDQLERLAEALRNYGFDARVAFVPSDWDYPPLPTPCDVALIVDTPSVRAGERAMLLKTLENGGTLVAIGPVPDAELFGVQAGDSTPGERALAPSAVTERKGADASRENIDWGPLARLRWSVRPTAETRVRAVDPDGAPVVTERTLPSGGSAWHIAVLPPARHFNGWAAAPDAIAFIAEVIRAAPARTQTADLYSPEPPRARAIVNTVAYDSGSRPFGVALFEGDVDAKAFAIRLLAEAENFSFSPTWVKGPPSGRWTSFRVPFEGLPHGRYTLAIERGGESLAAVSFAIDRDSLRAALSAGLTAWLGSIDWRWPREDSPPSATEIAQRAVLAWGLARVSEMDAADDRARYFIEQTGYWMRYAAPRLLEDPTSPPSALGAVAAGLGRVAGVVRREVSLNLGNELQLLAENAFVRLVQRTGPEFDAHSYLLWAAAELFAATRIDDYRVAAENSAKLLIGRQIEPGRYRESGWYGDFFEDSLLTDLGAPNGNRMNRVALLLGLIRLAERHPDEIFRNDIEIVVDRFIQGVLVAGAEKNAFETFPIGLEPAHPPRPRPDGRATAPPADLRPVFYARGKAAAANNAEPVRLGFAVAILERKDDRAREREKRLALHQLNHLLGLNPAGVSLWEQGRLAGGLIARGAGRVPVWRPDLGWQESAAGNAWLMVLQAYLATERP